MVAGENDLPKWLQASPELKKVLVIEGPQWDGEKFCEFKDTIVVSKDF